MKLWLRFLRFETGPQGKAETSMRNIPNSGNYLFLQVAYQMCLFCSLICLFCILSKPSSVYYFYIWEVASQTNLMFYVESCLSPSFWVSIPGYFPTRMSYPCWEHVSLPPPLTPSSSHTGCLMAPSTMCCMKAPVSTSPSAHICSFPSSYCRSL